MIKPNDRLTQLKEDWKSYFKKKTWHQAIRLVAYEILQLPYRHIHYLIVSRNLVDPLPTVKPNASITIRRFIPSDLVSVGEIDRPSEASMFARRLAGGQIGVAAVDNQMLIGYAWTAKNVDLDVDRINVDLEPFDFICTDAYTAPAHRNSGVQTSLILERLKIMRQMGFRRAICYIETTNLPSLKAWKKVGGYAVGEISYFRFGNWRWSRTSYHTPAQIEMRVIPIRL